MILKSILAFLILFISYELYVEKRPKLNAVQTQWQKNYLKAEQYLYESNSPRNVMVGSSVSDPLRIDLSPNNPMVNLSFIGQSVYDGLEIIKQKKQLPENIFIENNAILLRLEYKDFTENLSSPVPFFLKKHFLSLRNGKQFITTCAQKILIKSKFPGLKPPMQIKETLVKLKEIELEMKLSDYDVERQMGLLKSYIDYFRAKGVKVYFFEMPIDKCLRNLTRPTIVRQKLSQLFPIEEVTRIELDTTDYQTTDGVHLTYDATLSYAQFLKDKLISLGVAH